MLTVSDTWSHICFSLFHKASLEAHNPVKTINHSQLGEKKRKQTSPKKDGSDIDKEYVAVPKSLWLTLYWPIRTWSESGWKVVISLLSFGRYCLCLADRTIGFVYIGRRDAFACVKENVLSIKSTHVSLKR